MALTIGELVGFLRADDSGWRRGLDSADLRMRGLQRDTNGRLRDMRGRFVDEGGLMGQGLGRRLMGSVTSAIRGGLGAAFTGGMAGLQGVVSSIQSSPVVGQIGTAMAAGAVAVMLPLIGALLASAVIAVGGLSVIGLGAVLLKDEPQVKRAARRLVDSAKSIFHKAAKPMIKPFTEALKTFEGTLIQLEPLIRRAFEASAPFVKPLADGIDRLARNIMPGFVSMLEDGQPVFDSLGVVLGELGTSIGEMFKSIGKEGPAAGVALRDVGALIGFLIEAIGVTIAYLARAYVQIRGFIVAVVNVFKWLYDRLVGHSIVPDLVNAIVDWFTGMPGRIMAGIAGLVASVVGVFQRMKDGAIARVRAAVDAAVAWLRGLPGRAGSALSSLGWVLSERARTAGASMVGGIRGKLDSAITWIKGLPGRAKSALGYLGNTLLQAGWDLISGFISGISQHIPSVQDMLSGLTNSLTSWKGPESLDKRLLTPAGQMLIEGFQRGISSQIPALRGQLQGLTGELPGMAFGMAGGSAGGAAVSPLTRGGGGVVRVEINLTGDDEELKRRIRRIVKADGRGSVQLAFGR
jgi:hypothetical protein